MQELFLKSSNPSAALDMRKDLKQWEEAITLARDIDTAQLPLISKEYGHALELRREHEKALKAYEEALTQGELDVEDQAICHAGIARLSLYLGDIRRGKQLALESGSDELCNQCASILAAVGHDQVIFCS